MKRTDEQVDQLLEQGLKELRCAELPARVAVVKHPRRRWVWAVAAGVVIVGLVALPRLGARPAYALEDVALAQSTGRYRIETYVTMDGKGEEKGGVRYVDGNRWVNVARERLMRVMTEDNPPKSLGADFEDLGAALGLKDGNQYTMRYARNLDPNWLLGKTREVQTRTMFDGKRYLVIRDYERFYSYSREREWNEISIPNPTMSIEEMAQRYGFGEAEPQLVEKNVSHRGAITDRWLIDLPQRKVTVWVEKSPWRIVETVADYTRPSGKNELGGSGPLRRVRSVFVYGDQSDFSHFDVPEDYESLDVDAVKAEHEKRIQKGMAETEVAGHKVVLRGVWLDNGKSIRAYWTGGARVPGNASAKFEIWSNGFWMPMSGDANVHSRFMWFWQDDFFKPKEISYADGVPRDVPKVGGEYVIGAAMRYRGNYLAPGTKVRISIPITEVDKTKPARDKTGETRGHRSKVVGYAQFVVDDWIDVRDTVDLDEIYRAE